MRSAITKRSVVIGGHKTSVSLEEPFWNAVRELADAHGTTVSSLLRQIDLDRRNTNLSSAIRVHVLETLRGQNSAQQTSIIPASGQPWRPGFGPA
jgi:predicted DNA-binding ribbon-helix-helix protein